MSKILMIDDAKDNLWQADRIAKTYEEGIKALSEEKWDILLLDHDLGEVSTGMDILNWLDVHRERLPGEIKIITFNPVVIKDMQIAVMRLYDERGE